MRYRSHPALVKRKYTTRQVKLEKQPPEIVTKCDHCGRPLGRTCQRAVGSFVCAAGEGVPATIEYKLDHECQESRMVFSFFCSRECLEAAG